MQSDEAGSAGSPGPADGLWTALLLVGDGRAREVDWSGVAAWSAAQGSLWIHLDPRSARAVDWMRSSSGLTAAEVDDLLTTQRQPRFKEVRDGCFVASLSGFSPELAISLSQQALLQVWFEADRLITLCPIELPGPAHMKDLLLRDSGPHNVPQLMVTMAAHLSEKLRQDTLDLEMPMAELEFVAEVERASPSDELHSIETRIARLRRNLAPTRILLERVLSLAGAPIIGQQIKEWRGLADETRQTDALLQGLHDRGRTLHSYMDERQTERMNYTLYVLTILSAIMLPLTFLTGLFGMNIGIRGASYRWMEPTLIFLLVTGGMVALALFEWRLFKRLHLLRGDKALGRADAVHGWTGRGSPRSSR